MLRVDYDHHLLITHSVTDVARVRDHTAGQARTRAPSRDSISSCRPTSSSVSEPSAPHDSRCCMPRNAMSAEAGNPCQNSS